MKKYLFLIFFIIPLSVNAFPFMSFEIENLKDVNISCVSGIPNNIIFNYTNTSYECVNINATGNTTIINNTYYVNITNNITSYVNITNNITSYVNITNNITTYVNITNNITTVNNISINAQTPLSYNSTTRNLNITQANATTNGYLSSSDWVIFSNKATTGATSCASGQVLDTFSVGSSSTSGTCKPFINGSGTSNRIAYFSASGTVATSNIYTGSDSCIGIGGACTGADFLISSTSRQYNIYISGTNSNANNTVYLLYDTRALSPVKNSQSYQYIWTPNIAGNYNVSDIGFYFSPTGNSYAGQTKITNKGFVSTFGNNAYFSGQSGFRCEGNATSNLCLNASAYNNIMGNLTINSDLTVSSKATLPNNIHLSSDCSTGDTIVWSATGGSCGVISNTFANYSGSSATISSTLNDDIMVTVRVGYTGSVSESTIMAWYDNTLMDSTTAQIGTTSQDQNYVLMFNKIDIGAGSHTLKVNYTSTGTPTLSEINWQVITYKHT